ncbi:NACHT domain-containing protein [Gloeocapsopsis crepidinum LEGE 06123]|uniref:NACHT domain-containing protein n=1 Tax=Gloeocapsopsis crepidinum LEGE 06123 TaxID=588587 RepID=A0ABR9UTT9_9CHRO|nr:NB-ARC domain-containing protein [Gloeocapsopsis crepidinum]MBE9191712.1 NACHT domain-containing protein [Gloeocapsopsis crepidinum LEGE 06123]
MNSEEALAIVEKALVEEPLSKLQASVFRYAWEEQPYQEIAKELGYEVGYLKQTGSQLWQVLSRAFGEKVSKSNVQLVLKRKAREFIQDIHFSPNEGVSSSIQNIKCDWGNAPDVSVFYGRSAELATLEQWITGDRCRWIGLFGMGGIGKTCLAVKLAHEIQSHFEYVIWRSLRNAPPILDLLADLIQFLSQQHEADLPNTLDGCILRLLHYLRAHRCLLILDNGETIMRSPSIDEGYSQLFKCITQTLHQSTLVLTSREKPSQIVVEEGENLPVRSLRLSGLNESAIQKIFHTKGYFTASHPEWKLLVEHYAGNPLALKIVAAGIQNFFDSSISNFLEFLPQDTIVFGDIRDLLASQINHLPELEQDILYWLAINREPVTLSELKTDFIPQIALGELLDAIATLERKCLIDKVAPMFIENGRFTLQPVVMEYVTDCLIYQIYEEITDKSLHFFNSHALIKATAKDYIREAQKRLILQPITDKLISNSKVKLETKFQQILCELREKPQQVTGYAGGNILNILCYLQTNLSGWDFSQISIWQAYLCRSNLQQVNFASVHFAKSVFTDTFSQVLSVAFSSDGKLLATGDVNHEIHVWQVTDGKQILTFKIDAGWLWCVAFSPNGRWLASSANCTVNLWDVETGECIKSFPGYTDRVFSVAFSSDGRFLASGSEDRLVRVWDVKTGELLHTFAGHTDEVRSVAFAPQHYAHSRHGTLLASGSFDGTVRVWHLDTGECLQIVKHPQKVWCVAFSPNGRILASGSSDRTIKLWDISTRTNIKTLTGHLQQIRTVVFSSDGQTLASGSDDQSVRLWNYHTGEVLRVLKGHTSWISAVVFSPNTYLLASSSEDRSVRLWDSRTNFCLKTLQGHSNGVWCVAFSPDGNQLASGTQDRLIRFWDTATGKELGSLQGHTSWIWSVAFHPNENILASGSEDRTIRLWNTHTKEHLKTLTGHADAVFAVIFSPDGTLFSASLDSTIKAWNISQGTYLHLQGHQGGVWSIALSLDGTLLASGSQDQTIKIWDVKTGCCIRTLFGHTSWIRSCAVSPDQQYLISGSADGTIKVWQIETGECIQTLQAHNGPVLSIVFAPNGKHFATCGTDTTIKLWQLKYPACTIPISYSQTLQGHSKWVRFLSYNSNGILASCSQDETIKLWHLHSDRNVSYKTLQVPRPYEGMNITDAKGLTKATITTLKILGAVDTNATTQSID